MKPAPELLAIVKEHQLSLSLANMAINVAKSADKLNIEILCNYIADNFEKSFMAHFQTEEHTIFKPLMDADNALITICKKLIDQHVQLLNLAKVLPKQPELLAEFGQILQSHTRIEDRELFANITQLSPQQRQAISDSSNHHPNIKQSLPRC